MEMRGFLLSHDHPTCPWRYGNADGAMANVSSDFLIIVEMEN
jgi:hypothetical protein